MAEGASTQLSTGDRRRDCPTGLLPLVSLYEDMLNIIHSIRADDIDWTVLSSD